MVGVYSLAVVLVSLLIFVGILVSIYNRLVLGRILVREPVSAVLA